MTSDAFFGRFDPRAILGVPTIDLFLLDGLHIYEFLLREFAHAERLSARNSIVLLHDCLPIEHAMTHRSREEYDRLGAPRTRFPEWRTGDVWKLLPILARHRPDLRAIAIDCPPSGLIAVTNLDPASRVLTDRYADIVEEFEGFDPALLDATRRSLKLVKFAELDGVEKMARHFWL